MDGDQAHQAITGLRAVGYTFRRSAPPGLLASVRAAYPDVAFIALGDAPGPGATAKAISTASGQPPPDVVIMATGPTMEDADMAV